MSLASSLLEICVSSTSVWWTWMQTPMKGHNRISTVTALAKHTIKVPGGLTWAEATLHTSGVIVGKCDERGYKGSYQTTGNCLVQQVVPNILGNVWVYPCSPLLEPATDLHPAYTGTEERQEPSHHKNYYRQGRDINNYDMGGGRIKMVGIMHQPEVRAHVVGCGRGWWCGTIWTYQLI